MRDRAEYVDWIVYLRDQYLCRCESRAAARKIARAINAQEGETPLARR
jgi:hypothetical protein